MSPAAAEETTVRWRGFAARSGRRGSRPWAQLALLGALERTETGDAGTDLATWGLPAWDREREALLLSATARRHEHDVTPAEVRTLMHDDPRALTELLPTFAAVTSPPSGPTTVVADRLGFRHVFHAQGPHGAVVSTSSQACALEVGAGLDLEAVAVQSALGWQLGQRTLFVDVRKLAPGESATLADGSVAVTAGRAAPPATRLDLDQAVRAAAAVLRTHLAAYLDDHPDAGLQLTGGQDSRLLLSAIPPGRRAGVRVVTLGVPGDPDVDLAAELAERCGMRHELLSVSGLEELSPAQAYGRCVDAARRLDCSADPLAHAALAFAEARSEPGPRLSGLGGEVARGFYYLGRPTTAAVSPARAERLARWRMFVNEAVPAEALDPAFRAWARAFATQQVVRVLEDSGRPWMEAVDELYLDHRMQRWGGVTETAVCLDRAVVNPMLDDRFLAIADALAPVDKRGSRFLSRLQLELDPGLAAVPLDGRPPPAAYAHRSARNSARLATATAGKAARKVVQRVRGRDRAPVGGELLAAAVVEHWRDQPLLLDRVARLGVLSTRWLDDVVCGRLTPPTSAVALTLNLTVASESL